ncbi:hypothetical protein [Streptomyces sp. NPDC050535]|uniref:hypothetical protein n=1 Tax=Streptomyces sp. NPDC050535 TaxID=3365626 RepID=UPI0037BD7E6D
MDSSGIQTYNVIADQQLDWAVTSARKLERASRLLAVAVAASAVALVVFLLTGHDAGEVNPQASESTWLVIAGILGFTCFALLSVSVPWLITRRTFMKNQNARIAEQLKTQQELRHEALEKLKKTTELATLMELNQDQIATYHRIVTQQADKSFKSSRTAMGVGLFLIVCAAIGGAYVPMEEVRWFIGALAAFSTLLTGYLTKTYLAMYKESIGQLNRYFDQPVLNSFYLTAERLVSGLDEEHAQDVRCQIINEVLATSSRRSSPAADPSRNKQKTTPKKRAPKKQTSSMNGSPQA